MKVRVKFFTLFRLEFGLKELEIELKDKESITIKELLNFIDEKTGKKVTEKLLSNEEKIKSSTIILLNGKNIFHINGLKTLVKNGDELSLFPPGGGG